MRRLAGAVTGILLLALAASGGASADPKVGSCPRSWKPFRTLPRIELPNR